MNMSYCRFENTLNDLRDCAGALEELFSADEDTGATPLSRSEELAAILLVDKANDIVQMVRENLGLKDDEELRSEAIAEYISSENALCQAAEIARKERQKDDFHA